MPTASKSPLSDDMAALARQLEVHLATLGDRVVHSSVETSPADRRPCSIGAHLDTSACLGVLTLWESGSAFFEVVAATDGRSIARRQYEDLGLEELRSVIQLLVSSVMEGGESVPPRTW